jgi:hypothetical protein
VPCYHHTSSTSVLHASYHVQQTLIVAKEEIARYLKVGEDEPFGFSINDYDSFPWDYRMDEETDKALPSLIVTSDLFAVDEDLASGQQVVIRALFPGRTRLPSGKCR